MHGDGLPASGIHAGTGHGMGEVVPMGRSGPARGLAVLAAAALAVVSLSAACEGGTRAGRGPAGRSAPGRSAAHRGHGGSAPPTAGQAVPSRTSCHAVAHVGDSTSDGLVSADYLPDPAQRITAQYIRVGATGQHFEIEGATSVVETIEGEPNAYDLGQRLVQQGYRGCWVIALGTNDTADIAVGSTVGPAERIRRMMSLADGQPVLWVNVKSLLSSGPYAESNMRAWNRALLRACASYPNLRVYDWASVAPPVWFISDGIHYTSAGYAERARLIANALAEAFPSGRARSPGCLVS